jgi:hypothetical protein
MRLTLPLCALVLAMGCSSNGNHPGGGGSGGSGGGGGGGSGGGGGMTGESIAVAMTPFPVAAGQEVYMCQTFANPFGGGDVEIAKFHSSMSPGSHHMLLLFQDNATNGAITPCSGLTFGPMPFGAQQPEAEVAYPSGIASLIKSTQGFNVVAHYLNATPNDIMAHVTITMTKAAAGSVQQHAGVFFFNNVSALSPVANGGIPAHTEKTITASYTTTTPINLLYAVAHMHQRSLSLTASYGSTMLYQTNSWDNAPFQVYSPSIVLPAGTTITWSCDINNDTDQTLIFGESAQTNQMCIFDGQYYPANDADPSLLVTR